MPRVFRQKYTQPTADGKRKTRQSAKWYVEYRDAQGIRRRVPGYTDKGATQQLAAELERNAERQLAGLVDAFADHRKRPLREHLNDWHGALIARGASRDYADLVKSRATKALTGCGFVFLADVSASDLQAYLSRLRSDGLSIQTVNFYLQAVKQFFRWMVADRRMPDNPVAYLRGGNVRTDRRHDRRALDTDELRSLLDATKNGPERFGMKPDARAMLYQLAVETGLRATELRTLTWDCLDLEGDLPTVTVKAGYSKHRRTDTLPLKPSTTQTLARWSNELGNVDPTARLFNMPPKAAKMLRADLADAGLPYADADGRVADFHSLRHTYISNLARGGVHPKIAQQLARHSTITLTMDRYSHTVLGELSDALSALPELDATPFEQESVRATGTCGNPQKCLPISLPKSLPKRGARRELSHSSACNDPTQTAKFDRQENPMNIGISCASTRDDAGVFVEQSRLRPAGFEPATPGLGNRCSIQLSYERNNRLV